MKYSHVCVGGPLCGKVRHCDNKYFDHVEYDDEAPMAVSVYETSPSVKTHKRFRYVRRQIYYNQPLSVWTLEHLAPYEVAEILVRSHAERRA